MTDPIHPPSIVDWMETPPPPPREPWRDLVEPHPGHPLECVIVGRRSYGITHHWVHPHGPASPGLSRPCLAQWMPCPACVAGLSGQWAAYLAVWADREKGVAVARLSRGAVASCPDLEPGSGAALRGRGLILTRHTARRNGPVTAELVTPTQVHGVIPAEIDVVAWLFRLWGLPDARRKKGPFPKMV